MVRWNYRFSSCFAFQYRTNTMAKKISKEAAATKFTSECQNLIARVKKGEKVTVLLRTKLKSVGDVAAIDRRYRAYALEQL